MNDPLWHPLVSGNLPAWVSGWGQDVYGIFVEFTVHEVTQRMRWIPPGWFMMGSPEHEPGRLDNEGPQHKVTLSSGFWMCDTPCTQALWQAVMFDNPSHFQSVDRPVEQVSFYDAQDFLQKIETLLPGLSLTLPSEAQWEYACRAGSQTALYGGEMTILGENNAPALDPIAWYGGNSGWEFDLDKGSDSSAWPEKQYAHNQAGNRRVALKQANAWGLYDMLGNVWEWCQDNWHDSYVGAPSSGCAWEEKADAPRLLRGGAWFSYARYVRAACRTVYKPSIPNGGVGFRCARAPW